MKVFRTTYCRPGRALLVSALMFTTLVKSTVGAAMVLHQHGVSRAHLHVLGYADILSKAPFSSRFGHSSRCDSAFQSASQRVRIFTIVTTGSVFVSAPRSTSMDTTGPISPHNYPPESIASSQEEQAVDFSGILRLFQFGRDTAAELLLRNHTLLI